MAKKNIDDLYCVECDSRFKLVYTDDDVSRNPIFCPFCSSELNFGGDEDEGNDENKLE
jgi:hypothetical protein